MATIYDVARRASVSPKTVSRVLNSDGPVSQHTRSAVEDAMNQLGYIPNIAARSIKSQKTNLIGLITGAISTAADVPVDAGLPDLIIVQAIQKMVATSGKTLLISDTGGDFKRVPGLVRTFREHRAEGLIYVADYHRPVSLPLQDVGIRTVLVNCYDDKGTTAVLPDDAAGQYNLTREVIAAGHRRIAYLTLRTDQVATRLRLDGFRSALSEGGLEFDPELVTPADDFGRAREHDLIGKALDRFLANDNPPTAICCGNDRLAMAVYGILRDRGVSIPNDMSVVGYDDHRLISETLYPDLTTVELPYAKMGAQAGRLLLDMIENRSLVPPAEPLLVSGPVQRRGSLVAPRTAKIATNNPTRRN